VGFALSERHDAELAYGALAMAAAVRGGNVARVIFHTDQGSEGSTSGTVRAACERLGIRPSMGRPGSALDNAAIESWHSTLEFELRSLEHFATRAQARARIARWVDEYNTVRRHSSNRDDPARGVRGSRARAGGMSADRVTDNSGGGCAAADHPGRPAHGTGPPLRPQGCCASLTRRPCGPALTPETTAAPRAGSTGRPGLPPAARGAPAKARSPHKNTKLEVSTVSGDCHGAVVSQGVVLQMDTSAIWPCAVTWAAPGGRRQPRLTYPTYVPRPAVSGTARKPEPGAGWQALLTGAQRLDELLLVHG
jgi:hypothetical protein